MGVVRKQLTGEPAIRIFRVEAGHGVGKTFGAAGLVNWFFDAFAPSITMTTAPTKPQVVKLLWKDIKKLRRGDMPGRVLPSEPYMEVSAHHFAIGQTTSNSRGLGTERFQGQHDRYLFFVIDEAEGVPDFVFDAVNAMMTGGSVIIWLLLANPRTRTSRFFRLGKQSGVANYRFSVLDHPNVLDDADTVPGATSRRWVLESIRNWCEVVYEHDHDNYTFSVPYDVPVGEQGEGAHGPAGTIYLPNAEFLFRVMGVAPANLANCAFVSPGRYEAALANVPIAGQDNWARIGVDAARTGEDFGTVYVRHAGTVWRAAQISGSQVEQRGGLIYYDTIKRLAVKLGEAGVRDLAIRVDGTGGFGSTSIDNLRADTELRQMFRSYRVIEVHFGSNPKDAAKYADIATEMYAEAAEALKGLRLEHPPEGLEGDLTERLFEYVNKAGVTVRRLEEKERFKKRVEPRRSPDDGDGFVLAVAPDFVFVDRTREVYDPTQMFA